ncbi:MAG: YfhO family protein, partial [Oscillospiraceae bacterium]
MNIFMNTTKTNMLKRKSKNYYLTVFVIGIITGLLIFIPFLIVDNGLFLYYGDFNVQQIPFYKLAHDALNNNNFPWSWNTDLGANFVGSYSFYLLGSPFFWITKLFPSVAVPYLMAPLLILKFGLTCVTGYAFINRFTKKSSSALIGALLYAFSGFNIYNIFFNHFNEVVLIFPLLLIALEELVINNQRGGFALAVALCATVNYYFFFGQIIFVVIYFIIRCTSKDFNINFKKFLIICFEAVIGLLLSAVLLIPSILAIIKNSRLDERLMGYDMLFYNDEQRYGLILSSLLFPPDVPAKANFFENSNAKWSSVSAFLPLFSISGVIAFVKGKKKHWANKLILISLIMSFIPILNASFSAFNYSYYARWFYMPILIMAMMTAIAIENDIKHFKFGLKINAILVGVFLLVGIIPKNENDKSKWFSLPKDKEMFWGFAIIAILGLLICTIFCLYKKAYKNIQKIASYCLVGIIIIYGICSIAVGKSLSGENYYDDVAVKALHGSENIKIDDDDFYRIDTFDELDNLGMFWHMKTINAFHSIVPTSVTEYYDKIDEERGVASRPNPDCIGVRGLMNVKYSFIKQTSSNANLLA